MAEIVPGFGVDIGAPEAFGKRRPRCGKTELRWVLNAYHNPTHGYETYTHAIVEAFEECLDPTLQLALLIAFDNHLRVAFPEVRPGEVWPAVGEPIQHLIVKWAQAKNRRLKDPEAVVLVKNEVRAAKILIKAPFPACLVHLQPPRSWEDENAGRYMKQWRAMFAKFAEFIGAGVELPPLYSKEERERDAVCFVSSAKRWFLDYRKERAGTRETGPVPIPAWRAELYAEEQERARAAPARLPVFAPYQPPPLHAPVQPRQPIQEADPETVRRILEAAQRGTDAASMRAAVQDLLRSADPATIRMTQEALRASVRQPNRADTGGPGAAPAGHQEQQRSGDGRAAGAADTAQPDKAEKRRQKKRAAKKKRTARLAAQKAEEERRAGEAQDQPHDGDSSLEDGQSAEAEAMPPDAGE